MTGYEFIKSRISNSARRLTIKTAGHFAEEYYKWKCDDIEIGTTQDRGEANQYDSHMYKSVELLDKFIKEQPEEFERIVDEVQALNIEGPSFDEYLDSFGGNQGYIQRLVIENDNLNKMLIMSANTQQHILKENEELKLQIANYEKLDWKRY